jgi:hypothetical protein
MRTAPPGLAPTSSGPPRHLLTKAANLQVLPNDHRHAPWSSRWCRALRWGDEPSTSRGHRLAAASGNERRSGSYWFRRPLILR